MRFCKLQVPNLNDDFIKHQKLYEILRTAGYKILMMSEFECTLYQIL